MKRTIVTNLLKYGITCIVAGLLTLLVIQNYGFSEALGKAERYRILSDAFTIPGFTLVMVGLLIRIMDCGILDGLSYAMRSLYRVFLPMAAPRDETFWDYTQRKREARKGRKVSFILHVGILFMIPAIVFLILFYQC